MIKNKNKAKANMSLKEFVNWDWYHCGYGEYEGNLLHVAGNSGDFGLTKKALEYGAEVNNVDNAGQTALFLISDIEMAKLLIEAGINPDVVDFEGGTALIRIYERNPDGFRDIIEYLIPITNLDLPKELGRTLIFKMCEKAEGDYNMVNMVVNKTKNLNRLFKNETFLFDAGRRMKNDRIVLMLAKSGVDLYHKNTQGLDFYDCCTEKNKRLIEKYLPDFIEKRERELW